MGLTRQSVQRTVDVLEQEGIVAFCTNPHHRRAKLIALTAKGTALYRSAMRLQKPWATKLAVSVDGASLEATLHTLKTLRARLEELGKSGDRQ
jgi:DNA-binding MarR family transcriptional regulator